MIDVLMPAVHHHNALVVRALSGSPRVIGSHGEREIICIGTQTYVAPTIGTNRQ